MLKTIGRLLHRRSVERHMREEMQFHLDARIADLVARGMSPTDAARTARIEFGNAEAHRDDCRAALGYRPWDELRSDLRFAACGLRKQPGYSATAIAILAVAIGVNSAFFTLYSHHVLKPLPIRGADRHFDLQGLDRRMQGTGGWTTSEIDALAASQQVEGLYAARTIQVLVLEPAQRFGLVTFASANYFRLLGGSAAIGRTFSDADRRDPVAVLSQSGRRRHFPDDPSPLGKRVRVRNVDFAVIGVMPPEFTGTESAVPDFWLGAEMSAVLLRHEDVTEPRYSLSGLLAPGVSPLQAESALSAAAVRFPRPSDTAVARVRLTTRSGFIAADDELKIVAVMCFAAFLAVLAIACGNLANLCLSRASSRTHEIAMRLSLGASRGRIVRQLLTESTFMALAGAAGGMAIGALAVQQAQRQLVTLAGGLGFVMLPVQADWRVFLFSGMLGVLAGLAFGLLPAIEVTSPSLTHSTKRDQSSFAGRVRPRRLRNILIAGQVAFSLVLLILAGVLTRQIQSLSVTATGYDLDRIYDLKLDRAQPALLAQIAQLPAVATVTAVSRVPLYGNMAQRAARAGGQAVQLSFSFVDHRYFQTLELPVEGRGFAELDAARNSKVVVISQATARALLPGRSPFGQAIAFDPPEAGAAPDGTAPAPGTYEVVGVVPDVVTGWLFRGKDTTAVYFPAVAGDSHAFDAMVRIQGNPASAVAAIRRLCATAGTAEGCEPTSLRKISGMQQFPFAAAASVAAALGLLALILTAVGLYSVIGYAVVHRRREIGVHLALGAKPSQIMGRMLGEAWRCVVAGMAVGLPACLVLSRVMSSSVFGIAAFDPVAYVAVPVLLAFIAMLASAIPARRAIRVDPMSLLREE